IQGATVGPERPRAGDQPARAIGEVPGRDVNLLIDHLQHVPGLIARPGPARPAPIGIEVVHQPGAESQPGQCSDHVPPGACGPAAHAAPPPRSGILRPSAGPDLVGAGDLLSVTSPPSRYLPKLIEATPGPAAARLDGRPSSARGTGVGVKTPIGVQLMMGR